MSYDKNFGTYEVKFKDEKSYLHCRLNYIEYCEDVNVVGFELTFLQFIQDQMYFSDTCEVESINDIPQNNSFTGSDFPITFSGVFIEDTSSNNTCITWESDSTNPTLPQGPITFIKNDIDSPKEEPPEDPIDNRFDILDL